jgi:hypothetical protein
VIKANLASRNVSETLVLTVSTLNFTMALVRKFSKAIETPLRRAEECHG